MSGYYSIPDDKGERRAKYKPYVPSDEGEELNKLNFNNSLILLKECITDEGILKKNLNKNIVKSLVVDGLIVKKSLPIKGTHYIARFYVVSPLGQKYIQVDVPLSRDEEMYNFIKTLTLPINYSLLIKELMVRYNTTEKLAKHNLCNICNKYLDIKQYIIMDMYKYNLYKNEVFDIINKNKEKQVSIVYIAKILSTKYNIPHIKAYSYASSAIRNNPEYKKYVKIKSPKPKK